MSGRLERILGYLARTRRTIVATVVVGATVGLSCSLGAAAPVPPAPAVEHIDIAAAAMKLHGLLFRPAGAGPFPAIVALHGCEGLAHKTGQISSFYRKWAQQLTIAGFVVLFPDSYGSRGLGSQCLTRKRPLQTWHDRVADANAARRFLQQQPYVRGDRISLLGWSTGATAALWAIRPPTVEKGPDFRTAVVLYPGCRRLADLAWSARVPTLILIGDADRWSAACQQMVAGARGRSALATIIVYPGAGHNFDRSNPASQRHRASSRNGGAVRKTVDADVSARADALKRAPEWLQR